MKKYYLIGIAILLVGLFAYHFIAEIQAEKQLDEALQELNQNQGSEWSLQYSSIDVSSFTGDIRFRDITFIEDRTIFRSEDIFFDLGYLDFLRIYVGGLQFGLEYLNEASISLKAPVHVNRSSLREIKFTNLTLFYTGNALDLLRNFNSNSPLGYRHQVDIHSPGITLSFPETNFSTLRAAQFIYKGSLEPGRQDWLSASYHQIDMDSLTWTPSESFQNAYSFFIKGFGYATDAIPFKSARMLAEPLPDSNLVQIEANLESELATLTGRGFIRPVNPFLNSEWQNVTFSLGNPSEKFSNVLTNLEQLFSVSLPKDEGGGIVVHLDGTLSNTSFKLVEQ